MNLKWLSTKEQELKWSSDKTAFDFYENLNSEFHKDTNQNQSNKSNTLEMKSSSLSSQSALAHRFSVKNYMLPTFCAHCKKLLIGLTKQVSNCFK